MEYICTPFGVLWLARLVGLERRNYELRGRRTEGITFKYTHCVTQRFCDVVYGFALTLIRGSLQRAILGPVQLARRPASHPPDQRQSSAVTYVALCVVSAIVIKKRFFNYRATLRVTQRFCKVNDVCLRLKAPFRPSA
ncbi:hypothetical protein A247_24105, partial [Pseudomonas syringae pv. actinidiae ICMP 19099]